MRKNNYEFKQGVPVGAELICEDMYRNYMDLHNATLKEVHISMRLNIKECEGEILKDTCGILFEKMATVYLGAIGNFPAIQVVRKDGKKTETILSHLTKEEQEEYGVDNMPLIMPNIYGITRNENSMVTERKCLEEYMDIFRGRGWRQRIQEALTHSTTYPHICALKAGDYAIALDVNLEQVNNMADLAYQVNEYTNEEDDRWRQRLVYIEGVTGVLDGMTDEQIMTYDYFNTKPEGHEGGGEIYTDEDTAMDEEYGYKQSYKTLCHESCNRVWLLRGESLAVFINAEGHSYSKYLLMPIDFRESWKQVLEADYSESA